MEFKIVYAGTLDVVPGTETLTEEQAQGWLKENQVFYDEGDPEQPKSGDLSKYIFYVEE